MMDYSIVKCKLMEPRMGTGYTFSERSEFHAFLATPQIGGFELVTRPLRWDGNGSLFSKYIVHAALFF